MFLFVQANTSSLVLQAPMSIVGELVHLDRGGAGRLVEAPFHDAFTIYLFFVQKAGLS